MTPRPAVPAPGADPVYERLTIPRFTFAESRHLAESYMRGCQCRVCKRLERHDAGRYCKRPVKA